MLDEHEPAKPTPVPSATRAYTEADKIRVVSRILQAWFLCPGMRLGQLLYAAAAQEGHHVSQIKDTEFAEAVEKWCEEYR